MSDSNNRHRTREMLARHHRDGVEFVQLMRDTFAGRFDEGFWQAWQRWISPCLGGTPVILDLGTGPGLFLREAVARHPGARAIGVECAPYMLEAARADLPAGCEILEEDLHDPQLPLKDGSVDAALAAVVLHEMTQPVRALREVRRCLRPGGRLMVYDWVRAPLEHYLAGEERDVFDPEMTLAELEDTFTHFIEHNRFSIDDLGFLLEGLGFKVLDSVTLRGGQFARIVAERR